MAWSDVEAVLVYILANKKDGTLYTGFTSRLVARVGDHKDDVIDGFTKRYGAHRLVYFEEFGDAAMAIAREKQLKGWNRAWKIRLIENNNPNWSDLYPSLLG
ncbi:MAG: GIY-YIG nuclease family protein [Alphaproteobacteria bacterium]|nr:GIY-YIG nuclease family protein [Alphaproteobacteria bacterium]MBL6937674.1 GIY-YIG nuclease family protein [Alphaproteobacteria bacterium]MBL7099012.1 GIY-YIG nuclease family protein [Alphaproteobacteria bacterium]